VAQKLEVTLSGTLRDPVFRFVSSSAETIQELSLQPQEGGGDERDFLGEVTPTARQFRLAVSGADARGFAVQRVHAPLFTAEPR
jgi:hypothetical protein